jgi:tetratricopeptide (TPR) repeat protein
MVRIALLSLGVALCAAAAAMVAGCAHATPYQESEAATRRADGDLARTAGRFAEAADAYVRSYVLVDQPPLLLPIAECYERAGDNDRAIRYYRTFLDRNPEGPGRLRAEGQLAALAGIVPPPVVAAAALPPPLPAPAPVAVPPPPSMVPASPPAPGPLLEEEELDEPKRAASAPTPPPTPAPAVAPLAPGQFPPSPYDR